MNSHLLVVLAHPDDETFGCGGTIALHSKAGTPVTYVCATRGEMGRRMGNPTFATRESLGDLREHELRAACDALGIADLRLLNIWDKTVEFVDQEQLAGRIGAIIAEIKPSLIITFHPKHGRHPDHNAIGLATVRAVAALAPDQRPPVHCLKSSWNDVKLDLEVVEYAISEVMLVKQAAFDAHRSQSEGMLAGIERRFENDPAGLQDYREKRKREQYWVYRF